MAMKMGSDAWGKGGSWVIMVSMSTGLNACWRESKARPDSSEMMRSGLSCMMVLSLVCRSPLCHL